MPTITQQRQVAKTAKKRATTNMHNCYNELGIIEPGCKQDREVGHIEREVAQIVEDQEALATRELAIMENPEFRAFLDYQKKTQAKIDQFWGRVKDLMIEEAEAGGQKTLAIAGDWGTVKIAKAVGGWDTTEDLPRKYYKKVVDVKRITSDYHLDGRAPKGATLKVSYKLTKDLKND